MSVVWLIGVFLITLEADFAIGMIPTDCNATRKEYNTKDCSDLFSTCTHKLSGCDTTRFCSNECREIYHRMRRDCDNSSFSQVAALDKLELLCSPSSSEHNKTCADLIYSENQPRLAYGYGRNCSFELFLIGSPAFQCSVPCNNTLASYEDECCAINAGLLDGANLTPDKESIHTDRIWTLCGISSPGKCPSPPPPSGPTVNPTPSPTVSSTPSVSDGMVNNSTPSVSDGMVNIEANFLLLFTTAALLCMYTLY
ncbi:uncharacterized protein [Dysidea avara]|uniref:uncharacterized protein n=1 Tax=Dysidea avara TaxID=196820 RepID=UPI003326B5FE